MKHIFCKTLLLITALFLLLCGCSGGNDCAYALEQIHYIQYAPYGNPEESFAVQLSYNGKTQTVTCTGAAGENWEPLSVTISYDELLQSAERYKETAMPDADRWAGWKETRDPDGRLLEREKTEFDGLQTVFRYDGGEMPVSCRVIRDSRIWDYTFTYDGNGRLIQERCEDDDDISIIRWTYDSAGRVIEKRYYSVRGTEEVPGPYYLWSYNRAGYLTGYQWYGRENLLIEELTADYTRIWAPAEMTEEIIKDLTEAAPTNYYQGAKYDEHR